MAEPPTWRVPLDLVQRIEVEVDGVRYRPSVRRAKVVVENAPATIAMNRIEDDYVHINVGASSHLYRAGELDGVRDDELDRSYAAALIVSAIVGHPRVHQARRAPRFVWSDHVALARGEDPERAARYSQHVPEPVADHVKRMRGRISVHEVDPHEAAPDVDARTDPTVAREASSPGQTQPAPEGRDASDRPVVTDADVEEQFTEWARVRSAGEPHTLTRREHSLVLRYKGFLEDLGYTVVSKRIHIPGEGSYRNDLFVVEPNVLVEAKDEPSREKVRTAIGQIVDYRRHVEPEPACALLVSRRPSADLEQLLGSVGVSVVWETDGDFADNTDGASLTT